MPKTLPPPQALDDYEWFLLIWSRDTETFAMILPSGRSYDLGNTEESRHYFTNILKLDGICGFGERILQCAVNWPVIMVIPGTEQCYSIDTEESDKVMGKGNLFKTEEEIRDEPTLLGINPKVPGYI